MNSKKSLKLLEQSREIGQESGCLLLQGSKWRRAIRVEKPVKIRFGEGKGDDARDEIELWGNTITVDVGAHFVVELLCAGRPEDAAVRIRVADEGEGDEEYSGANMARSSFKEKTNNVKPHKKGLFD